MWTLEAIADATKGTLRGGTTTVHSVIIDSREAAKGALFVALKGDRLDGHDYVQSAFAAGVAAALVSHIPEGVNGVFIQVTDTYQALVNLAKAARKRTAARVIGVTGSVGKTGTKDAIRTALSGIGSVYATRGNLNNHIGLPLSLANLPEDADFGVFELGMNHAGEIAALTRILQPDIAVITNVEAVHLEFFADVKGIADAKAEIMEGLPPDGTLILNRDNVFYERLLGKASEYHVNNVLTFGEHAQADYRLVRYQPQDSGSSIEVLIGTAPFSYPLHTIGRHWAITSLATLAVIGALQQDIAQAAAHLARFQEPEGRGKAQKIELAGKYITLIDDCYNASPVSVKAAIARLAEVGAKGGRKIAVLGDMLELGNASVELHGGLLPALLESHIDKVYACGSLMEHLYAILPLEIQGGYAGNSSGLAKILIPDLQDKDTVLIKGSHGSQMDKVRDAIIRGETNALQSALSARA